MRILVLGPIAVHRDGRQVDLGPRLARLLAALAASDGSVVSVDRLVDIVWSGEPPRRAEATLRSYVTRLRKALDAGRDDVIVSRPPGYAIQVRPGELDSAAFEDEVDTASQRLRTGDHDAATSVLRAAIGRWRGDAYGGMADEEWARPEVVRLQERLVEARELLVEAELAANSVEQAVADAQALVESEPLRERPRALLMRALYAAGRQAEALRVFGHYRRYLAEETGLEPSDEIAELDARIARGDAAHSPTRQLRGYELGPRIGEGAFAVVHQARQPGVDRDVAIKIIRAELADRPEFVKRFEVEAKTVARIEHPNVVPLYDFWRVPGAAYLAMRLLRGGTVEQALRTHGPYTTEQVVRLLDDIGGALETAHRLGVVHRDVRPTNLLLDEDGTTYLADFGIALPAAVADDLPIVSPQHAAPEVLRGEPAGVEADVLSLAVTVYELLTGHPPFSDSTDRADLVRRQLDEPLPPVRAVRPELAPVLDEILRRATAKFPQERYASAAALVHDLRAALTSDPATARRNRPVMSTGPVDNPYRGLHAFDEQDADRFFGREQLVGRLVDAVDQRRLVAVVGPSGSGKSSVVRAGLLPAVRQGAISGSADWFVTSMIPGSDPVDALEAALLRVAVNPPASLREQLDRDGGLLRAIRRVLPDDGATILLLIDQFEELFTQVEDATQRHRFLSELAHAITDPRSPLRVVATLRADHYDAPLRHPEMAELVTEGTITVQPMTPDELERAITLPARALGVDVEPGLVAELVTGVLERPAALPLLQFSLTELFDRRVGDVMLSSTHHELGGLTGAIAARADRIVESADPTETAEVRRIFGRLVTLGDGVEDTRRRALRSELGTSEHTDRMVDAFVTARLLTADRDPSTHEPTIEIAHEALLRDWPRLRSWLADDRADLRTLHGVRATAAAWDASDHDAGDLARGGRLEAAADLATRHPDWLNDIERGWVDASRDAAEAAAAAEAEAIARDRHQNRRLRGLLAAAAVLLVVAVAAAGGALVLRNRSVDAERTAEAARDEALDARVSAESAREDADIERIIAQSAAQLDAAPDLAILLALEANRQRDDVSTQTAVHRAIATDPRRVGIFPPRRGADVITQFSDDGSVALAWSIGGTAEWFDPITGESLSTHETGAEIFTTALSGDGDVAALVLRNQQIEIVHRDGVRPPRSLPLDDVAGLAALDDDGDIIAYLVGGVTYVADATTGDVIARYEVGEAPDGQPLNTSALILDDAGGTLSATWNGLFSLTDSGVDEIDVPTGELVSRRISNPEYGFASTGELADDGSLVAGYADGVVRIFGSDDSVTELRGHSAEVLHLAVGNNRVASAGADDVVRVWSLDGDAIGSPVQVPGEIDELAVGPDGRLIVAFTGGGHLVVDAGAGAIVEQRWPVPRSGVFPASSYYDTPSDDFWSLILRRLDDDQLHRDLDFGDVFATPLGGQPFYSADGEWIMTYESDGPLFAITEIHGDRQYVHDADALYRAVTGSEPGNESFVVRPDAGGERLFMATTAADGQERAAWINLATGDILDGPADVPVAGPVWLLDDGRVAMGNRGEDLVVLAADLDDAATSIDDTLGLVPMHQDAATGRVLAAGQDGFVALIDPDTSTLTRFEDATGLAYAGAFSPDGDRVAVTTLTDGVQLYDVASGRRLGVPTGLDTAGVEAGNGVRWTDDGTGVWTAPEGGPIRLAADPDGWREIACDVVHRELTPDEWRTFVSPDTDPVPACPAA